MTKKRDRSRKALLENVDAAVEGKSTERLLRESEKRYRELVENITETIYEVDESGRVTYVSPVATTTGDYGLHEIAGRSFAELIHPEDLPRALEAFEGWLRGDAEPLEFRLLTKSGEARWHHSLARPMVKAGRSVGVRGVLTDITERKRTEAALRESEEKFRLLAENAVDVVYRYRLRPNPGYEYISPSVTAMTGYAPHEFYADPDLDMKLVHPDDQGLLRLIIDRDLPGTSTLRCVHRDGSIVWMELTYTPFLSHDGTLLAFEGISRDITERKRAEEALRESEERFRSAFEHSAVGMALVAPDGRLLRVNHICCETLGYSEQEMISTTWQAITHPDDRDATQENVRRVLAGESSFFQIEKRFIHKNGHVMWGLVTSSLLRDCDGKPSYFITQIQDITERKAADEVLRESEEKYRDLVENITETIYEVDAVGRVTYVSPAVERVGGYAPSEITGRRFDKFVHADDRKRVNQGFEENVNGALSPIECRILSKSGEVRWVHAFSQPIHEEDRIVGFRGVLADITERKRAEEALRESEEKYRELVENINETIYEVDPTGRVVFVNHAAEGVGGYNRSEIIGSLFTDFLHPDERRAFTVNFRRAISSGEATPNEYRLLSKTGETLWFRTNGRPVFEDGRFVAFRGILTDITERKRAEDALRESEERFRTMSASAQDAIVMLDSDGKISFWNGAAKRIFGYSAAEAIGKHLHSLLVPERVRQASEEGFARFRATGRGPVVGTTVEFVAIKRDGTEFPIELSVASVKVRDEWSAIGIVRDVTERKRVEEAISHLAYHDALTGLPNRSLFVDRLTVALAQARRGKRMVAVMALDLDRFKVVNDTVGHAEGDQLLRQVGEQLAGLSRDGDTVARFGGDEFMVLLPQVSGMNDAIVVAERILEALREPKTLGGKEFRVTTSIGLAVYPGDGADADSLLRSADSALYRAKEEGRDNCQVCTPAIAAERQRRLSLEQDLRRALVLDEIAVHYQPMVDIETGEIMGLEALARWKHPKHGLLPPVEFIPVAEETGLIVPLGERVLQIAARQHRAWREKGLRPGRLAVNFSARQIRELSTVDLVVQTMEETGLDPQHLQVEITEQTAMQDVDVTLMILAEFKMAGIRIAVDDFGVGYSSLSYLTSLPVDFVKIDRSFVRDLTSDPADAAICASIIAMSHSLKLKVIAEGVETEEQLAFLRERGGDEFQGYLFSKPLPPSGITKMLQRGKRLPVLGGLAGAGPTASS